jgi:hypothetical protein
MPAYVALTMSDCKHWIGSLDDISSNACKHCVQNNQIKQLGEKWSTDQIVRAHLAYVLNDIEVI